MALFLAQEHADNPPNTWKVVKAGRVWHLQAQDGTVIEYGIRTKAAAETLRTEGPFVAMYEKERRWYRGENVPGWKPYAGPLLPYSEDMEGCGFFTILDAGGNPQKYHVERAEAHDDFGLPMDCVSCAAGEATKHKYEEPILGSDLTDCLDSCKKSIDHEGPC